MSTRGELPLITASAYGNLDKVKFLVEICHADVNLIDGNYCFTPLLNACYINQVDIVKYLIETYNFDVNLPNTFGHSLLLMTCRLAAMSVSMFLLCEVSDLDVNIFDSDSSTTPHYAV